MIANPIQRSPANPATEKQFKYFVYLCKGVKGMTSPEMGKIQRHFEKKYNLWSWSDIDTYQISGIIDFVTKHWNREGKYPQMIKDLYL